MSTNGFGHSRVHDSDTIEERPEEVTEDNDDEYDEEGSVVSSIVDR